MATPASLFHLTVFIFFHLYLITSGVIHLFPSVAVVLSVFLQLFCVSEELDVSSCIHVVPVFVLLSSCVTVVDLRDFLYLSAFSPSLNDLCRNLSNENVPL